MKFFSWMQSKLQGKVKFQNKESPYSFPSKDFVEEVEAESIPSSLPPGLLAIGTFGNNNSNSNSNSNDEDKIDDQTVLELEADGGEGDNKSNHKSIVKKSVPFLLKKLFVCGSGSSGFAVELPPRPQPQDARMKKILKMMLEKKIYPKNSSNAVSLKRFIKEKDESDKKNEDEKEDNNHGGH